MTKTHPVLRKFLVLTLAVMTAVTFLSVNPAFAATKLKVTPTSKTITVGKSVKLKANKSVKWYVKKGKTVVKLTSKTSKTVKVKGLKAGTASIKAKVSSTEYKMVKITVKAATPTTPTDVVPQAAEQTSKVYVSAAYVRSAIYGKQAEMQNPVVLEVGWGTEADDPDYGAGHIPGAIHFNTDLVENNQLDGATQRWDIRGFSAIKTELEKIGITQDTPVIVYSDGASNSADDRVAFALLWAGVKNVKALDGGYGAWTKAGYETEKTSNTGKAVTDFGRTTALHPDWIVSTADVTAADSKYKLVSIRSYEEYIGQTSGYGYIARAGEPKGAIWGHDTDDGSYNDANGNTVTSAKIAEYIQPYGATLNDKLAFYCGTGWRATIPFLIMYQEGYTNMYLWDDGWYVYNTIPGLPVQIGDPAKGEVTNTTTDKLPETYTKLGALKYENSTVDVTSTGGIYNTLTGSAGAIKNNVTYTSSDPSYVSVTDNGTVSVIKLPDSGVVSVTITATAIPEIANHNQQHASASFTITLHK